MHKLKDTFVACGYDWAATATYVRSPTATPNFPAPAIANPLYVIAAMPCGPVIDFIDIGYYGRYWK